MHAKKLLLTLALVFVPAASLAGTSLVACSSSTTNETGTPPPGPPGNEAGAGDVVVTPTDGAPADAPMDVATDVASSVDGGTCNMLKQAAPEATSSTVKGAAPAATGGTILAGTYFLTELNVYDPNGTASAPMPSGLMTTLVIAADVMDSVQDLPDGSEQTFRETFSVAGTKLTRDITCPKPGPDLAAKYSVTGTGIVIYETDPMSSLVAGSVYAKQ